MDKKTPGASPAQAEAPIAELPGQVVLVGRGRAIVGRRHLFQHPTGSDSRLPPAPQRSLI